MFVPAYHTHTFEGRDGGTLCIDDVRYRPRGGALMKWPFVRRDAEDIFAFRTERLAHIFRGKSASSKFPIALR